MRNKKGFTLVELMVVMAIIAILVVLIVGAITLARRTASETENRGNARTLQTALEYSYAQNRAYTVVGTSAAPSSFNAAATALSITIVNGSKCTGAFLGGGQMYSTTSTYTITPAKYDCTAMTGSDVLTVN